MAHASQKQKGVRGGKSSRVVAKGLQVGGQKGRRVTFAHKIKAMRKTFGVNQVVFSRMMGVSQRTVAGLEAGKDPSEQIDRRLKEIQRLQDALLEVMTPESISTWLETPNSAFEGLKPLEVIERGEADRIWQMIFLLRSGVPA